MTVAMAAPGGAGAPDTVCPAAGARAGDAAPPGDAHGAGSSFCSAGWSCCGVEGCCAPQLKCCEGAAFALLIGGERNGACIPEDVQCGEADASLLVDPFPARARALPMGAHGAGDDPGGGGAPVTLAATVVIIVSVVVGAVVVAGAALLAFRRLRRRRKRSSTFYMGTHVPLDSFSIEDLDANDEEMTFGDIVGDG